MRVRIRKPILSCLWIRVAVLCLLAATCAVGQPQPTDTTMSADEIIQVLQQNPDLLAEAKQEIAVRAQDRGYAITPNEISDDRLFSEIRSDDRVRAVMSNALKQRGYGVDDEEKQSQSADSEGSSADNQQATKRPSSGRSQYNEQDERELWNTQSNVRPGSLRPDRQTEQAGLNTESQPGSTYRNLPAIKDLYGQAIVPPQKLQRFGASLFRNPNGDIKAAQDVSISSDYVIGPGDELVVQSWGSDPRRLSLTVDRVGRVLLPETSVFVSGLTLAEAQEKIQSALSHVYKNAEVDVTLGKLRTVHVFVVGDVKNPGAYEVSPLASALSVLIAAGGPTDQGSLRTVKHFRGDKLVEEIDLYDLMLKGVVGSHDRIQSGDSILVPPVGPQVTIAGMVRRPAIYELRNGETSLDQVLNLAGGVQVSAELGNVKVERVQAHERKVMMNVGVPENDDESTAVAAFKKFVVQDGDSVTVAPIPPYTNRIVYLQGHVFEPGKFPYKDGLKVTDLVQSYKDVMPEPADRADIVRLRPPDYRPEVIPFNLHDALANPASAPALQPFDTVRIYGRYEQDAPKVSIRGEVLHPGEYPLSDGMSAADLVKMAGGFKRSAYTQVADLSSYSLSDERADIDEREVPIGKALEGSPDTDVRLKPGDVLTIRRLGDWDDIGGTITVDGEVLHPGQYAIRKGERLSSVIKRAGGFLDEAYPNGSVLDRAQVRQISARQRDELIEHMQMQALETNESLAQRREREQLIEQLRKVQPNGRMVIKITTDLRKWENTPADVEVRAGDVLKIPKRPNFVLIAGQVYGPTAITWVPGRSAAWYLHQAGGPTRAADKKNILVVRANGSVIGNVGHGWISGNVLDNVLQPGDAVYVPEKNAAPGRSRLTTLTQLSPILSGAAVAASVASTVF